MPSSSWPTLLQQIPADQYDCLCVVTRSGIEIALQSVLKVYPEFVAIKGRMAGSEDQGRVFFIPYENLDYLGFTRQVKDDEFHKMFGEMDMTPEPEPLPAPAEPSNELAATANRTPPPVRSVVLERFRARTSSPGVPARQPGE